MSALPPILAAPVHRQCRVVLLEHGMAIREIRQHGAIAEIVVEGAGVDGGFHLAEAHLYPAMPLRGDAGIPLALGHPTLLPSLRAQIVGQVQGLRWRPKTEAIDVPVTTGIKGGSDPMDPLGQITTESCCALGGVVGITFWIAVMLIRVVVAVKLMEITGGSGGPEAVPDVPAEHVAAHSAKAR
jgi:hypothetical protein